MLGYPGEAVHGGERCKQCNGVSSDGSHLSDFTYWTQFAIHWDIEIFDSGNHGCAFIVPIKYEVSY